LIAEAAVLDKSAADREEAARSSAAGMLLLMGKASTIPQGASALEWRIQVPQLT